MNTLCSSLTSKIYAERELCIRYFDAINCPEDRKPVGNNKNSKKVTHVPMLFNFFL